LVKYLLLAAVVFGIVFWLSGAAARVARNRDGGRSPVVPPQERMVTCAHCGVNLPESDSVAESGRFFCNDEHRLAGPR
jgi:uncharacterized protein